LTQVKTPTAQSGEAAGMDHRADIDCCCHATGVAIEGGVVAQALGLAADVFRRLIGDHHIVVRCERGVGDDEGLYRATFYHGSHRARLVVDAEGQILTPIAIDHG
jgi:hypothetical protein